MPFFKIEDSNDIEQQGKPLDDLDSKISEDDIDPDDKDYDSNSSSSDTLSCCDDCCSWDGDDDIQSSDVSDDLLTPLEDDISDLLKEESDDDGFSKLCKNDVKMSNHSDRLFWGKPCGPDAETCSATRDMEVAYLQSHTEELEMLLQSGVSDIFNDFESNSSPIPCFDITDDDSAIPKAINSSSETLSTTNISEIQTSVSNFKITSQVSKASDTGTAKGQNLPTSNGANLCSSSSVSEPQITVTTTNKVLDERLPAVRVSDFVPCSGSNNFGSSNSYLHPRLEVVSNPFTAAASLSKRLASSKINNSKFKQFCIAF